MTSMTLVTSFCHFFASWDLSHNSGAGLIKNRDLPPTVKPSTRMNSILAGHLWSRRSILSWNWRAAPAKCACSNPVHTKKCNLGSHSLVLLKGWKIHVFWKNAKKFFKKTWILAFDVPKSCGTIFVFWALCSLQGQED